MRLAVLALAASALALSACGKKETTGNTSAVDQAVSAEDFATSDATAIDAALGADANMAADVDINFTGPDPDAGSGAATMNRTAPRTPARSAESNTVAPANETQPSAPEPAPPAESNSI